MNDKLLLELIKIIKQSKRHILKVYEDNSRQSTYVNFDTVFDNIEKHTKVLANTIKKEAKTFNKDYDSEEQMIETKLQRLLDGYLGQDIEKGAKRLVGAPRRQRKSPP